MGTPVGEDDLPSETGWRWKFKRIVCSPWEVEYLWVLIFVLPPILKQINGSLLIERQQRKTLMVVRYWGMLLLEKMHLIIFWPSHGHLKALPSLAKPVLLVILGSVVERIEIFNLSICETIAQIRLCIQLQSCQLLFKGKALLFELLKSNDRSHLRWGLSRLRVLFKAMSANSFEHWNEAFKPNLISNSF